MQLEPSIIGSRFLCEEVKISLHKLRRFVKMYYTLYELDMNYIHTRQQINSSVFCNIHKCNIPVILFCSDGGGLDNSHEKKIKKTKRTDEERKKRKKEKKKKKEKEKESFTPLASMS